MLTDAVDEETLAGAALPFAAEHAASGTASAAMMIFFKVLLAPTVRRAAEAGGLQAVADAVAADLHAPAPSR